MVVYYQAATLKRTYCGSNLASQLDAPQTTQPLLQAFFVCGAAMQVEERGTELPNVFASFAATLGALQGGELDVIEAAEAWATSASECGQELEAQVWSLVSTFYASRLRTLEPLPTATDLKYLTPSSLVSAHLNSSQALADLAVLKDWLCATSPQPLPADIRRGYAPYSKHNNNSVSRQGKKPHSLDPDASLRHQSAFAPEDSAYDESLLRSLYELVRIGDLYQAVDLCRQADADWRAASLNGAAVWSHSKLEKTGGEQSKQTYQGAEGNLNRKLWKTTARKVAKTPSVRSRVLMLLIS